MKGLYCQPESMGRADAFMLFQIRAFKSKAHSGNPVFLYWLHFPQQSDGAMALQAASKWCCMKTFLCQACPPAHCWDLLRRDPKNDGIHLDQPSLLPAPALGTWPKAAHFRYYFADPANQELLSVLCPWARLVGAGSWERE